VDFLAMPQVFELPPSLTNGDGKARTVGVEIEFGGVDAEAGAELVKSLFGGSLVKHDVHGFKVNGSSLGDFFVKLDSRFGHYSGKSRSLLDEAQEKLSSLVGAAANVVVPTEIVTPPIPIHRLFELEDLLTRLRAMGASGTESSLLFAFGLHINPETPRLEPRTIAAVLKAFAMLSPWLWRTIDPDTTRRLLGFAEPFPTDYVRKLARDDYWPDLAGLIDDYVTANPTRNRDLDLLPLFLFLDETRVRRRLPDEKINPRPTFHYRLPDTRLDDPEWGLAVEWNRWVAVERLAEDSERLAAVCRDYLRHESKPDAWVDRVSGLAPT
jgi:hypothetical protein